MGIYYDLLLGEAVPKIAPVEAKRGLGRRIVERFHGPEAAEAAERHFDRLHKEHLPPEELEEAVVDASGGGRVHLPAVLADHFGLSRSEARRLLGQGGVRLNGEPLGDSDLDIESGRLQDGVLQVGRRRFKRIRVAS
jgi:tyrosyl-tRNA synthetase